MGRLYKEYVIETLDAGGNVAHVSFRKDRYFNFGYDIIDRIARRIPTSWLWSGAMRRVRKGLSPSRK